EWREDGDLVEENNRRREEIAEAWAAFQAVERTCYNKIISLVPGGKPLTVNDGSGGKHMHGYDAEALKQAKGLPWGDPVKESTPWYQSYEHVWDFGKGFVVDGVWGTVKGLGTLVGVDGWESMKQAWTGLGNLTTGVILTVTAPHVLWLTPEKHLPGFVRDARNAMKETGKALIAYDQWGENPARAGGAVTFNVLTTVFTGGAGGGVSGAGKAAAAAKALSFANKAGRVVDPTTYLFKGAGAGLTRISDVMTGLKNTGHIEIPPLPPGVVTLPEGGFKFGDGTLHLPPGATVPESAFEIPRGSVKLPAGAEIPTGAVYLGDGIVHLPEGMTPPAGSLPIQEGALKLPEGTTALPQGTARGIDDHGNVIHLDRQGNILSEDGTLKQHHTNARPENPPADSPVPAEAGSPLPRTPAHESALVGAGARGGSDTVRLGSDVSDAGSMEIAPSGSSPTDLPVGAPSHHAPHANAGDPGVSSRVGDEPAPRTSGQDLSGSASAEGSPPHVPQTDSSAAKPSGANSTDPSHPGGSGDQHPDGASPHNSEGNAERPGTTEPADPLEQSKDREDKPAAGSEGDNTPDYTRPALLPAEGPLTLRDVRNTRPTRTRWERGEEYHRQMWGGGQEKHYPVPTSKDSRYPVTARGGRKVDVPVTMPDGRTVAVEVKTYGPYRSITLKDGNRRSIRNEVPLSAHIKEQIHKDLALREIDPKYDPRWSFTHAGPSDDLRAYLKKVKIIFLEYGKTPKKY
ncbi:hypothetical protein ACH4K1_16725, partial [Streptomyces sp. NPDC017448]